MEWEVAVERAVAAMVVVVVVVVVVELVLTDSVPIVVVVLLRALMVTGVAARVGISTLVRAIDAIVALLLALLKRVAPQPHADRSKWLLVSDIPAIAGK